jgi:holliday junction DNA helicase RuvA
MIAYITGKVIEREEKALIIDVQGVGYRVFVGTVLREKARKGETVTLRIYHHISEGGQALFGFEEREEQQYFELLLTVPSIGAKMARNILDVAPPRVLDQAVATKDVTLLTKVSGVGKRTAERLVVELQEKIKAPKKKDGVSGALQQEIIEALTSIGYTPAQARQRWWTCRSRRAR